MATVLVSFIGAGEYKGREYGGVSGAGYKKITYYFDGVKTATTTIFGSALLQYLKDNGQQVETWLIMGTSQSIWCDLVEMFGERRDEIINVNFELWEFLYEQATNSAKDKAFGSNISQAKLDQWQELLTNNLTATNIICRLVGDATDAKSQNLIFQSLLDVIKDGDKVVFDVTHGLRNQPLITSFVLMYLRYLRHINAENIEFYYGAKDLGGKVVKLDFCTELLQAIEAVAIFEQTGNVRRIGEQLNLSPAFQQNLDTLAFADEMFRLKPGIAQKIKNELAGQLSLQDAPVKLSLADNLRESMKWSTENLFAKRLRDKAVKEFGHKQYFKAIASLWEAVIISGCRKFSVKNPNDPRDRQSAEKALYDFFRNTSEYDDLQTLEHLRNSVLHGSNSNNPVVRKAVENVVEFQRIFEKGLTLINKLLEQ